MAVSREVLRRLAQRSISSSGMGIADRVEYVSGVPYGPPPDSPERMDDTDPMPTSVTMLQIHGHFFEDLPPLLRRHAAEGKVWERNSICLTIGEQTGDVISAARRLHPIDLDPFGLVTPLRLDGE